MAPSADADVLEGEPVMHPEFDSTIHASTLSYQNVRLLLQ